MRFKREEFAHFYNDAQQMLVDHNAEVDNYGLPLQLELDTYLAGCERGWVKTFTIREGTQLVGYGVYFIYNHTHHKNSKQASLDALYVSPEKRGIGLSFMRYCEQELKKEGAEFIKVGVPKSNDWSLILKRKGYSELETVYIKEI